MSIHSSLKLADTMKRHRSVLKRLERVKILKEQDLLKLEESSFLGLPKVKHLKIRIRKEKVAAPEAAGATAAAPSGAEPASSTAPGAGAKPSAKAAAPPKAGAQPAKPEAAAQPKAGPKAPAAKKKE